MDQLAFDGENRKRIQAVQNAFGLSGEPLYCPGRTLMGEGTLMKKCRKNCKLKAFFLFSDILVYGSILVSGRWYKKQKVIALENIKQEDMEDSVDFENQWLICTPSKSFYVSAMSYEEKQSWMKHIDDCQRLLLQDGSRKRCSTFAVSWIPDQAAEKCLRCLCKFTNTMRRHHCRKCGFLVCKQCSKKRAVIDHIHPTKLQRICKRCHQLIEEEEKSRLRVGSTGEDDNGGTSSDDDKIQSHTRSSWLDTLSGTWGLMDTSQAEEE
ncbi:pleckstrin homology domain-containing family F member 2-like [Odontesthes bonariensis]|uniref:pleckstrin homology domain-containing family F member 2-like n=1 Tax=Odontesthes bonariensis TaxID=219752 RepID=UPI003F58ED2C